MSTLETFERSLLYFRMAMPPPAGVTVCRANKATFAELADGMRNAGCGTLPAASLPTDAFGIFMGAALVPDESLADGVFDFVQRLDGWEWTMNGKDAGPQCQRFTLVDGKWIEQ